MKKTYRILHFFCGIGGKSLGAQRAIARLGEHEATFETIGGIDSDPLACRDFGMLVGAPALCVDVHKLEPEQLRAFAGDEAPDAIREALIEWGDPQGLELVHVEEVDGVVVPGKSPCCWQCSRLVVEVGLRGVWLFEVPLPPLPGAMIGDWFAAWRESGVWRFYTAADFHRETLRHERNKLPVIEAPR